MSWRDDKPTQKQLSAIINIRDGWEIIDKKYRKKPKTKGEACDMISELTKKIEEKKYSNDECLHRQEMGDMEGDPYFYGQS